MLGAGFDVLKFRIFTSALSFLQDSQHLLHISFGNLIALPIAATGQSIKHKESVTMPNILRLQKLNSKATFADPTNMFASVLSVVCPADVPNGANGLFEME
jgi:hypothetical protein